MCERIIGSKDTQLESEGEGCTVSQCGITVHTFSERCDYYRHLRILYEKKCLDLTGNSCYDFVAKNYVKEREFCPSKISK